ncbi:enoyl-CoA hydratase-related protein [Actinomadura sp. LOL_016]|uniref:enoyl-CoA hydratase-related protein n=1 Tax=unclassified Actinomadura TaxID=2626254 RepID=UPI003A7F85CB
MADADILVTTAEGTDGGVAVVTLNRPGELNTLTQDMTVELWETLVRLDGDPGVRAIVVTGAGRAFCAGAALDTPGTFAKEPVVYRHRPWELRTPVIAAINGAAVGLGLTLPLQWDVRFVAEDAELALLFTRRGVVTEAGSAWIVPRLIGMSRAMELMVSGRYFTGVEAVAMGLAARTLPREDVLAAAIEFARDLARNTSPIMVAATKRLLWECLDASSLDRGIDLDERTYEWVRAQPDPGEGIRSFLERRPPAWPTPKTAPLPDVLIPKEQEAS